MTQSDMMQPLPDGPIAEGTLVWGADFNAAVALLYRWWGLLDAPPGTDISRFSDDLFDDGARMPWREAGESAHHLGYDDYRLRWIDGERFRLHATFLAQREAGTERRVLAAMLRKRADGVLVFQSLDERTDTVLPATAFVPSYIVNRARATSAQFQAHMDALTGDASGMRDLMMPRLELHGLVASKADRSSVGDAAMTDVNDLRKSIAGTDHVADNAIRDFAGFSTWFATAPVLFRYGLHKLEHLSVAPLAERRFEIVAQYDWRAETVNGARIETHQPLTWVFVDTDEAFMRIEKLLPFG